MAPLPQAVLSPDHPSCPICGGTSFAQGRVLSEALVAAWALSPSELACVERGQALHCSTCAANLRSMTLAAALMHHFSFEGVFEDFVRDCTALRTSRVLEINEAGALHPYLQLLPRHQLASFPETDMQQLKHANASWDLVLHSDTLEHIPDPAAALAECFRVLRPGGLLAFTVPLLTTRLSRTPDPTTPSYHGITASASEDYRVHTEFGADAWLDVAEAGFSPVSLHAIDPRASVALLGTRPGQATLPYDGERLSTSFAPHRRIALEHLHRYALASELAAGLEVVDIASGEGYGSALLAQVARSVVGVDRDPDSIAHATAKYARPNLSFAVGTTSSLPVPDASVDLVVSFETLEHVDDHEGFLREIRRVLRPGGTLVISTPDRDTYSGPGGTSNPHHVRELDRAGFEQLLSAHFAHVALLGQRTVLGSWLCGTGTTPTLPGLVSASYARSSFTPGPGAPTFWIAVCGDSPPPTLPSGLALPEEEIHRGWLEAFELLPSPALAVAAAEASHALTPRPALASRVAELEAKLAEARQKADALRAKLAEAKARRERDRQRLEERAQARRPSTRLRRWLARFRRPH